MATAFIHATGASVTSCNLGALGHDPLDVPAWYAIQTRPRHEKRVAEELRLRAVEEFLPLYSCRHRWKNGVVAQLDLPLFPCYLFAKVPPRQKIRLLQLPSVIGLAVTSAHPTALAQEDIDALRLLTDTRSVRPHPFLDAGDPVRIIAGPLAGMEGILARRKQELRVVLSLQFIMRSVAVEVSEFDIEPAVGSAKRTATSNNLSL